MMHHREIKENYVRPKLCQRYYVIMYLPAHEEE